MRTLAKITGGLVLSTIGSMIVCALQGVPLDGVFLRGVYCIFMIIYVTYTAWLLINIAAFGTPHMDRYVRTTMYPLPTLIVLTLVATSPDPIEWRTLFYIYLKQGGWKYIAVWCGMMLLGNRLATLLVSGLTAVFIH